MTACLLILLLVILLSQHSLFFLNETLPTGGHTQVSLPLLFLVESLHFRFLGRGRVFRGGATFVSSLTLDWGCGLVIGQRGGVFLRISDGKCRYFGLGFQFFRRRYGRVLGVSGCGLGVVMGYGRVRVFHEAVPIDVVRVDVVAKETGGTREHSE